MELIELWRVVKKRLWMIVVITVVATGTSGILSKFVLPKQYASASSLMVIPHNSASDLLTTMVTGQQVVDTYAQVATSRTVLQHVESQLNFSMPIQKLAQMIQATPVTNTDLLTVQVTSTNPNFSSQVANAVAQATVQEVQTLTQQRDLQVVDSAVPTNLPVAPKTKTNVAIALVLGLMVGGGLAFLLEYLDDSLRTEEDVKRVLDLPVLTAVPFLATEGETKTSRPGKQKRTASTTVPRARVDRRKGGVPSGIHAHD